MRLAMKFFVGSSSGMTTKMAHLLDAKRSASIGLSRQMTCSSSESKKALSFESTVDMTDAIA